ncbi:MAG: SPOR domain-containing protein, partial [Desulfobacterales bacterium]|nr:SPOR domain-containing protein [Desulfobacterales bacterium]
PLTSRILVWGAVLIIITVTVRYFVTYDAEQLAQAPVADSGQLFHKIAPVSPPATSPAPVPPAAAPSQAAPPPKIATPAAKPIAPVVSGYPPQMYPYAIHMASLKTPAVARKEIAHYRRGFQAFIVQVDLGEKGIWYRLYFGHFSSATGAKDAISKYHLTGALVSRTRYACLLGSYPSVAQADAAKRQLAKEFFPYTIAIGNAYHVFVGAHPTLAAARALSKKLSAAGFSSNLIER